MMGRQVFFSRLGALESLWRLKKHLPAHLNVHGKNIVLTTAILAVTGCFLFASAAGLPTREITSNNIYGLAGNGDTVWMVTDQGVNFTMATSDTLSWFGYKAALYPLSLAFGGQTAVLGLDTSAQAKAGSVWYYNHSTQVYATAVIPFKNDTGRYCAATGAVYANGFFYMACNDGGLIRFDPVAKTFRAFFQNIPRSFDPVAVKLDSLITVDSLKPVISVAVQKQSADTATILALTEKVLYRFSTADTSWSSIPNSISDTMLTLDKYTAVFCGGAQSRLFATLVTVNKSGYQDSALYFFDHGLHKWKSFDTGATSLTFGTDSSVYIVKNSGAIKKYSGYTSLTIDNNNMSSRMSAASGANNPERINDIIYLPKNDTAGALWIGTSAQRNPTWNGLYFSRHEEIDERNNVPFVFVRSERKINSGLKETYAVPGILNNGTVAMFAYSLAKASNVSIAVYDWNMNLVKNVIAKKPRLAGLDDPLGNGRSTNRKDDIWDGTNSSGRRVAVGVYYFKITAENGERSFGKIIVAQ